MISLAALWLGGKHNSTARRTGVECLMCVGPLCVSKHFTIIKYVLTMHVYNRLECLSDVNEWLLGCTLQKIAKKLPSELFSL